MNYTKDQLSTISNANLLKLINLGKSYLKKNKVVQKMFNDYDVNISYLDLIPIIFNFDLEVSAQTIKGCIHLSYKLINNFFSNLSYIVHETDHVLKQITGDQPTANTDELDSDDYLASPEEKEAFKIQIDYMEDQFGEEEANKYVEHLLNYHSIKEDRAKRKKELLD